MTRALAPRSRPRFLLALAVALIAAAPAPAGRHCHHPPGAPLPPASASAAVTIAPPPQQQPGSDRSHFWDGGGAVLLGVIPTLLWVLLAGWAIFFLGPQILRLMERLKTFKGWGVELEFAGAQLDQAAENHHVPRVPPERRARLLARLARSGELLRGARILWVDDNPGNNRAEQALLSQFGALVAEATDVQSARAALRRERFDIVLSDMTKDGPRVGRDLPETRADQRIGVPVIAYTGADQAALDRPAGLFGITNQPDELIHLILDARARMS